MLESRQVIECVMRTTLLLLFVFTIPLVAAPIPKKLKGKVDDLERLQGLWQEALTSHNGEPLRNSGPDDFLRIDGETISTWDGRAKGFEKRPFTLDTTTTPKRLSVKQPGGNDYNFCFDFDDDGQLLWVEMSGDKTEFPKMIEPAKGMFYSISKKVVE
jgi:uncharacterized protein (TIGR03067 family)